MAPLPDNSTGRIWVKYTTGNGETSQDHEVMWRYDSDLVPNPATALGTMIYAIMNIGAEDFFSGWSFLSARYSVKNSDISLPLALPSAATTFVGSGDAEPTAVDEAREVKFVARSASTGRRSSWSLYGLSDAVFTELDFRLPLATNPAVAVVLDTIEEAAAPLFLSVDGTRPVYYPYANYQYNSYWERQLRA